MTWFSANRGCSATSSRPASTRANTCGVPAIGVGSSVPLRTIRRRPSRSVTRMLPSGKKARLHGCESPVATGTTRIGSSDEKNVCGSAGTGGDERGAWANANDATTRVSAATANTRTPIWELPPGLAEARTRIGARRRRSWSLGVQHWELGVGHWELLRVPSIRTRPAYFPTAEERADACRA